MRFEIGIVLLLLSTALAFLFSFNQPPHDVVSLEFAISYSLKWAGAVTALVSLVGLLHQWWTGPYSNRMPAALLPFVAGFALYSQHWGAVVALAVLGASLTARLWRPDRTGSG